MSPLRLFICALVLTCACVASGWGRRCARGCAAGRAGRLAGRGWSCSRWAPWAAWPAPGSCRTCCVCPRRWGMKAKNESDQWEFWPQHCGASDTSKRSISVCKGSLSTFGYLAFFLTWFCWKIAVNPFSSKSQATMKTIAELRINVRVVLVALWSEDSSRTTTALRVWLQLGTFVVFPLQYVFSVIYPVKFLKNTLQI